MKLRAIIFAAIVVLLASIPCAGLLTTSYLHRTALGSPPSPLFKWISIVFASLAFAAVYFFSSRRRSMVGLAGGLLVSVVFCALADAYLNREIAYVPLEHAITADEQVELKRRVSFPIIIEWDGHRGKVLFHPGEGRKIELERALNVAIPKA